MIEPKLSIVTLLTIATLMLSCDKEKPQVQLPDEVEIDNLPPQIVATSIEKLIETQTEVAFRISDDSQLASLEIWINGEPFDYIVDNTVNLKIDPYDYSGEELEIKIKAVDEYGNSQEIIKILQLKKLLLRIPHSNILDPYYLDHYVLINSSDGTLLQVVKVKPYEDMSIYASQDFNDLKFTASLFSYTNSSNPNNYCRMYSFENVERGSILPSLEHIRAQDNYEEYPEIDLSQVLSIDPPNPENPAWLSGYGYWNETLTDSTTTLRYSSSTDPKMLVRSFSSKTTNSIDSFKYFWLRDLTRTSYGSEDFLTPESFYEVEIPDEMKDPEFGSFMCLIDGYESAQDYSEGRGHNILNLSTANINIFKDGITVPEISEFEAYDKLISGSIGNGYTLATKQKGLAFKPLPKMALTHNEDSIVASGDFDEVLFEYGSYNIENAIFDSFNWKYYTSPSESITIPFGRFEIPSEIEEILLNRNLKPKSENNDGSGCDVSLIKIENYSNYSNRLFEHNYHFRFPEWSILTLNLRQ